MKKHFLNLQLFAEDDNNAPKGTAEPVTETGKPTDDKKPLPTEKPDDKEAPKYTDADVDNIVKQKKAEWHKAQQKAVDEAQKLAQMSAEEKAEYERQKDAEERAELQKRIDELERAAARVELGKEATKLLREKNIEATEGILSFVVGNDAEQTKANIDAFVKLVEEQVKKAEIARATGTTPKIIQNKGDAPNEIQKRIAKYQ